VPVRHSHRRIAVTSLALGLVIGIAIGPAIEPSYAVRPAGSGVSSAPSTASSPEMREDQQWRDDRAKSLSGPEGWLTLVGLEWLKPGKNAIGLAADNSVRLKGVAPDHLGIVDVEGGKLTLAAPAGGFPKYLYVDGKPAQEGPLSSDDTKASVLSTDNLTLVVLHRGDRFALRIKDSQSSTRTSFKGLHWYPLQTQLRVTDKPGTVVLDFNRLQNPPCAYTPYATCPLPPFENRLAISIPAGEERYSH
jgi:uncharacterized protein (DUF1684 family)